MHRFRKKSDAQRSHLSSGSQQSLVPSLEDALPELPPTNDFRTSLILPDLSRRFSVLRTSTDPKALDSHLRSRFADQRARGEENQITEEEEDMLLETLGRMRLKGNHADKSQENVTDTEDGSRNSVRSGASSIPSSPSARSSGKRYSNNLFGSGRLRDYTYLKSVASSKSSTRTVSLTPTESSTRKLSNPSLTQRPVTPDTTLLEVPHTDASDASPSTTNGAAIRSAPLLPTESFDDSQNQALAISEAEFRLTNRLGPTNMKRASLALEQVIKEIEEEVEEEILLPRSNGLEVPAQELQRNSSASNSSGEFAGGMAISIDKTIHEQFHERRASPAPSRTVPGYVPGMPRPMTPRDFDIDEQRSHSTTPRAQSPSGTSHLRRDSTSSTTNRPTTPISAAPLFLQRTTNGRFTPTPTSDATSNGYKPSNGHAHSNSEGSIVDFESALTRRRPASPLSGPSYQPMAAPNSRPNSRPGTPSNVIWNPTGSISSTNGYGHTRGHSRNNSWTTDGGMSSSDFHGMPGMGGNVAIKGIPPRNLRSPALPDSPVLESTQGTPHSFTFAGTATSPTSSSSSGSPGLVDSTVRAPPPVIATTTRGVGYIPEVELGSPILAAISHFGRSATPTQTGGQRSPVSPVFSNFELSPRNVRRGSKQSPPHGGSSSPSPSPFAISTFPGLGMSARGGNSSRSSLESVGSSFHSWDEPGDKIFDVFSESKDQQPAWHDFSSASKSTMATSTTGADEELDSEEVLLKHTGLKKADVAAIQEKLVAAAFLKIANTDPRDRAPSSMRRRRPSTSQSNYAATRIASPPPQVQQHTPVSPTHPPDDHLSKASALLNSVVESIQDQPTPLNTSISSTSSTLDDKEASPNTRRNRALAHVLFGSDDGDDDLNARDDTIKVIPQPSVEQRAISPTPPMAAAAASTSTSIPPPIITPVHSSASSSSASAPTTTVGIASSSSTSLSPNQQASNLQPTLHQTPNSPYLNRNPSKSRIPQTPQEQAELAREVQQKADAAMIALNKNPSRVNLVPDGLAHQGSVRRKIDTSQISTPKLVSTTTNLETMPLAPTVNAPAGQSKLGSRFKKLRGSLRAKNVVTPEEPSTSAESMLKTPPPTQVAYYDPAKLYPISPNGPTSAGSDTGRFKLVPVVQSPPASSGPGLKGFMARFRNKQRMSEMPASNSGHSISSTLGADRSISMMPAARPVSPLSPHTPHTPTTPRMGEPHTPTTPKPPPSPSDRSHNLTPRPAGQPRPMYSRFPPANAPVPPQSPTPVQQQVQPRPSTPSTPQAQEVHHHSSSTLSPPPVTQSRDSVQNAAALEQLFAAANNLGLDQNALNDLLARSGSISSRTLLTRNNSASASVQLSRPGTSREETNGAAAPQAVRLGNTGTDDHNHAHLPHPQLTSPLPGKSIQPPESPISPVSPEESVPSRKPSMKRAAHLRQAKEGQSENPANAVVRRTIIYANDGADFAALVQRKTSTRRKRQSANSISSRSVHDRVPTPPPPKSPTVKRFSADGMPPMPQLPDFLAGGIGANTGTQQLASQGLSVPFANGGAGDKSHSTYESLYDMYGGDSRAASTALVDNQLPAENGGDQGPALEVIQLANGEMIWNIVNGLRDADDDESIYSGRTSFTSEYSATREGNDGLQVFVKDHNRSGSKGSVSSFISKKKPQQQQQGKLRPETKVFYSSSAQIGRLIENLSKGADAGSFNFLPNNVPNRPGHSASSSLSTNDINWTVEERLDRMIGAMNNPS